VLSTVVKVNGKTYWTVRELAEKAGVPPHRVYKWLKGEGVARQLEVVQFNGRHHIAEEEWQTFAKLLPAPAAPQRRAGGVRRR
jgi:hypothetical protein